jgi:hypothetical protein
MGEGTGISAIIGQAVASARAEAAKAPAAPRGYEGAREVQARARVAQRKLPVETQAAMIRLDKVLRADQPPRADVPRGYYLDIVV